MRSCRKAMVCLSLTMPDRCLFSTSFARSRSSTNLAVDGDCTEHVAVRRRRRRRRRRMLMVVVVMV
jgi:hypothetical protein